MAGTATYGPTSQPTQDPATYWAQNDSNWTASQNVVDAFACHQAATANMTVLVDAGIISAAGSNPVSVGQQTSAVMTAPTLNPRNDLAVLSATTGALSIITGTEASTPTDPPVTSGKIAVARIRHVVGEAAITNSMIDDLRAGSAVPATLPLPPIGNSSGNLLAAGNDYVADTSVTVDVVTVALSPAPAAYYAGMKFKAKVANANTGPTVVNVNGLGNQSVVKGGTTALVGGELPQGWVGDFLFDGTSVQLMNPAAPVTSVAGKTGAVTLASTDLTNGTNVALHGDNVSEFANNAGYITSGSLQPAAEGVDAYLTVIIPSGTTYVIGNTYSGGGLPSGTWRCMGLQTAVGQYTNFQRIS